MRKVKITHWHYKTEITLFLDKEGYCFCPVCGIKSENKNWRPYDSSGIPSYDICKCCNYEYGFDDIDEEFAIELSWENFRDMWLKNRIDGSLSLSEKEKKEQLKNIQIYPEITLTKSKYNP